MTKDEAHELHMQAWNEMAETGVFEKFQTCAVKKYKPLFGCFLCAFYKAGKSTNSCGECPLSIGDKNRTIGCACDENQPWVRFFVLYNDKQIDTESKTMAMKNIAIEIAEVGYE